MLIKLFDFIVYLFLLSLISVNLAFSEYKIAVVNFSKIINECKEAKSAKIILDKTSLESRKLIENLKEELTPLQDKVKQGEIKPGTPEGDQVREKTQQLIGLMQSKESELKTKYVDLNKSVAEKVIKIIEDYSKKNDINIVLDQNTSVRNGVLLAENSLDITAEIIEILDR